MADQIMMNISAVEQLAGRFRSEASAVEQTISTMNSLVSNLNADFKGETSDSFVQKYEAELKPNFQRAKEEIENIAKWLDQEAKGWREKDIAGRA